MDTNIAQKIARSFVHGLAFAKGLATLAQDAKAKMEEGDKWITIGAEPGDNGKKHGGRHVLISGTGEVKAGLSKSAQGKPLGEAVKELKDKAESKKAENKKAESKKAKKENLSFREMARRHSEQKAAEAEREAGRSQEEKDKAAQLSHQLNMKLFSYYDGLSYAADNLDRKAAKAITDKTDDNEPLQNALRSIRSTVRTSKMFMRDYYQRIVDAAGKGKIDNARATKEFDRYKSLSNKVADIADSAMDQINELRRLNHDKVAQAITELSRQNEAIQDTLRGQVQGLENSNIPETKKAESAPETHAYSAKELDSMKQKQEGRAKTKKQNAELNRKLKEGVESGNIRFPRNEFRERAKVYTEQANQVINDDLKPSVDKLGSAIRKNTDNARMPQSTLDDLNDIHNLAKQIGPMASKLNKYNEKYAAEHDDPSNFVISNYGVAAKGTAERVAKLARRAAAMSNQLTAPDDERDYSEGRAKQEIRDILEEMRGLHGDLLKKTRHAATAFKTEKPSNSESDRVDAMYAQKGSKPKQRMIN